MQILPRERKKRNVKERAPESPCIREKTTKPTQPEVVQNKPTSHRPLKIGPGSKERGKENHNAKNNTNNKKQSPKFQYSRELCSRRMLILARENEKEPPMRQIPQVRSSNMPDIISNLMLRGTIPLSDPSCSQGRRSCSRSCSAPRCCQRRLQEAEAATSSSNYPHWCESPGPSCG